MYPSCLVPLPGGHCEELSDPSPRVLGLYLWDKQLQQDDLPLHREEVSDPLPAQLVHQALVEPRQVNLDKRCNRS